MKKGEWLRLPRKEKKRIKKNWRGMGRYWEDTGWYAWKKHMSGDRSLNSIINLIHEEAKDKDGSITE